MSRRWATIAVSAVCLSLSGCVTTGPPWMQDHEDTNPPAFEGRQPSKVLRGKASYYANSLAGNRTANGERYRPRKLTAASRDLPFGTIVRVVREDTGKSVTVRINDRGPFGDKRRILDLSRAAAERLDMIRAGVVDIRAEILAQD